jgi:hypothetical protein
MNARKSRSIHGWLRNFLALAITIYRLELPLAEMTSS